MITHIVWWTLKDEALGANATENREKMITMLRGLEGNVPSLRSIAVSTEFLGTTTESVQVVLISSHDDAAGLKAYADHPEHLKCVEFIKQIVATRKVMDFVV